MRFIFFSWGIQENLLVLLDVFFCTSFKQKAKMHVFFLNDANTARTLCT